MELKNPTRRFASRLALACVLGALLASALPAVAAAATGISGRVTDAQTNEPISAAGVCAYKTTTESAVECKNTNVNGEYELAGLAEESYKIRFTATEYTTQWYNDEPD
ncbi:MAG TPA: carboxypeptidase regulatory-like domain-containing protein, partial [Solirubrobacteraceae bacterium]|nr:carboxypeptidase regulatory-like domain-containing protein [Solirubrobacteraceae bacterium]